MSFPLDPSRAQSSRSAQGTSGVNGPDTTAAGSVSAGGAQRVATHEGQAVTSYPGGVRSGAKAQRTEPNVILRYLSTAAVGAAAGVRCLLAVGTLTLSERIAAGIEQLWTHRGTTSVDPAKVAGELVTENLVADRLESNSRLVHAGALPKRVPTALLAGTRGELEKVAIVSRAVGKKIDAGADLFARIQQGQDIPACTDRDASDLIWFMEAQSQLRGRDAGLSVSLGDKDHKVQQFLETHPGVYSLPNGHRAIDFYTSDPQTLDGVLPREMHSLVFHQGQTTSHEDRNRLFLGLSQHGTFLSFGGDDAGPHRLGNRHDVGAFIARAADGLRESLGLGKRSAAPEPVKLDPYAGAGDTSIKHADRISATNRTTLTAKKEAFAAKVAAEVGNNSGLERLETLLPEAGNLARELKAAGDLPFSVLEHLLPSLTPSLQTLVTNVVEKVEARRVEIGGRSFGDQPLNSLHGQKRDLEFLQRLLGTLKDSELVSHGGMGSNPLPAVGDALSNALSDVHWKIASHEAVEPHLPTLATATTDGRDLVASGDWSQIADGLAKHQAGAAALNAAVGLAEVVVAGVTKQLESEAAGRLTVPQATLEGAQADLSTKFSGLLEGEITAIENSLNRSSQPSLAAGKAKLEALQDKVATDPSGLIAPEVKARLAAALGRVTDGLAAVDLNLAATRAEVRTAMRALIDEAGPYLTPETLTTAQLPLVAGLLGKMERYVNRNDAAVGGDLAALREGQTKLAAKLTEGVNAALARTTEADGTALTPLARFHALTALTTDLPETGAPAVVAQRNRVRTELDGVATATVQEALDELTTNLAVAVLVTDPGEQAAKLLELMGRSIALTAHAGVLAREAKALRDDLAGRTVTALEQQRDALRTKSETIPAAADSAQRNVELTVGLRRLERTLQACEAFGRQAWPAGEAAPEGHVTKLQAVRDSLPELQWGAAKALVGPDFRGQLLNNADNLGLIAGTGPVPVDPNEDSLRVLYRAGALGNARFVEKLEGLFSGLTQADGARVLSFVQGLAAGNAAALNAFLNGPEWDDLALSLKREGALQRAMAPAGATAEERAEANERIARALATVELEHQLHGAKRALELTLRAQDGWRPSAKTAEQINANPAKFAPGGFQALAFDQRTVASLKKVSLQPPLNAIAGCNLLIAQLAVQEQEATLQRENRTLTPEEKTALAGLVRTLVGGAMAQGKTDDEVLALAKFGASFKSTRELEQLAAAFGEFAQKMTAAKSGPLLKALAEYRADQGDGRPDAALVVDRISAHTLQRAQAVGGAQFEANPTAKLYADGWIAATVTLGTAPRVKLQNRMERIGNLVNNRPPDVAFLQGVAAKLAIKGMHNPAATSLGGRMAAAVSSVVTTATGEAGRSVFQTYLGVKSEGFRTNPAPTLDPGKVDLANVRKLGEYVGQGISLHSAPLLTAANALSATMASLAHHENQGAARQSDLMAQLVTQITTLKGSIPNDALKQAEIRRLADAMAAATNLESREAALNSLKNLLVAEPLRVRLANLATLVATLDSSGSNVAVVRGEIAASIMVLQAGLPDEQPMKGHFGRLLEELKTAVASGTPVQRGAAVDRLSALVDLGAGAHAIYQAQKTAGLYNLQPDLSGKILQAIPLQGTNHTGWLAGFPPPPDNAPAVAQMRGAGLKELEKVRRDAPDLWRLAGGAMLDYFSESSYTDLAVFRADLLGVVRPDGSLADPAVTTALGAGLDQHLAGLALNNIGNAAGSTQSQALSLIKLSLFVHGSADKYLAALKDGLPEVADVSKKTSGALHAHLLGYSAEASLLTQAVNGLNSGEMLEIEISTTGSMRVKAPVAAGVSATGGISATRANTMRITKEGDTYVVVGKTAHHGSGSVGLSVLGDRLSAALNAGGSKAAGFVLEFAPRTDGPEGSAPATRVSAAISAIFSGRTRLDALGAVNRIGADRIRTVDEAGAFIGVEASVSLNAKLPGDLEFVSLEVGLSAAVGADIRTRTEANAFECRRTTAKSWEVAAEAEFNVGVETEALRALNPFADHGNDEVDATADAAEVASPDAAAPEEENEPTQLSEVRDQALAARTKAAGFKRTVLGGAAATPPASNPSRGTALVEATFRLRQTDERSVVTRSGVVVGDTLRRQTVQIETGINYDEDNARANFDRMLNRLGAAPLISARLQGNLDTMRNQRPTAIALRYNLTQAAVHAIAAERVAGRPVEPLLTADASYELSAIEFTVPGQTNAAASSRGSDDVATSAAGLAESAAGAREAVAERRQAFAESVAQAQTQAPSILQGLARGAGGAAERLADVAVAAVNSAAAGVVLEGVGEAASEVADALGGITLRVKYDQNAGITLSRTYSLDLRADAIAA